MESQAGGRQPTGVKVIINRPDESTTDCYLTGTGSLLGWCIQTTRIYRPTLPVSVKMRGGDAACQSQQPAAVAPGTSAFISS